MKSKTKIKKQSLRKMNSELVETIMLARKNKKWLIVASILSAPSRKKIEVNLDKISDASKNLREEKIIVVPGKILSMGNPPKKVKVAALKFSGKAKEKLLKSSCDILSLKE